MVNRSYTQLILSLILPGYRGHSP